MSGPRPDARLAARHPAGSGLSVSGTAPPPGEDDALRGRVSDVDDQGVVALPVAPPPRVASRVTVIVQVYHQTPHAAPLAVRDQYAWKLESDEAAYVRPNGKAGGAWQAVDLGWLGGQPVEMILISNDEGRELRQTIPSKEEVEALEKRVLEVSFGDGASLLIRPRMTQPLCPADPGGIRLRAQSPPVRFTLTVIPR